MKRDCKVLLAVELVEVGDDVIYENVWGQMKACCLDMIVRVSAVLVNKDFVLLDQFRFLPLPEANFLP